MTALRLAALAGCAIAVAAIAGVSLPRPRRDAAASRPAATAAPVQPVAAPAAFGVGAPSSALRDLSPGILGRAAAARALERAAAPACAPAARPGAPRPAPRAGGDAGRGCASEADACASGRDTVEIEWDVARSP